MNGTGTTAPVFGNHSKYPVWKYVLPLPSAGLMGTVGATDIENFFVVGDAWSQVMTKFIGSYDTILDMGCGCGRTARFLVNLPDIKYVGFDIFKPSIEWCSTHLTPLSKNRFRFFHFDGKSDCYNPQGIIAASEYRFPTEDRSVDLAFAASVFTHLKEHDAVHYLRETCRVLRVGGKALLSIHIEPKGGHFTGDENRIDIEPSYFVSMAANSGLAMKERIGDICGQEAFLFERNR